MKFSQFGDKFTGSSGILQLMDDLGDALNSDKPVNMLGGGNPARIEEVNQVFSQVFASFEKNSYVDAIENVGNYSNPQGDSRFIAVLVDFFRQQYGWQIDKDNIALTNGSQNAFFYLFNLFGGKFNEQGKTVEKSILLPLAPEYIGYADVHIEGSHFVSVPPKIEEVEHEGETGFFKYRVDFEALERLPEWADGKIGAICCSRPTNPTGNVLTDEEMARLDQLAQKYGVPLIVDNAYGMPFPNIIHTPAQLTWHDNIILCCSLSKIGLPGVRTGIIVAAKEVIKTIASLNAIVNLAPTRFGAAIAKPLLENGELKRLADKVIQPFYHQQVSFAVQQLKQELQGIPFKIHKPEGAIFLWLWFPNLPISSQTLYQRLKEKGTLIIPSRHFFVGLNTEHYRHADECIRMSIAADKETLVKGIQAIGAVLREVWAEQCG